MTETLRIAFFGSSLVSAYWNGAATYYRGIIQALHDLGHRITFYEPDAYDRQRHRDLDAVSYARSVVYRPDAESVAACLNEARAADVVVKCSGVGVLDDLLEEAVLELKGANRKVVFWDVDAPATLERAQADDRRSFSPADPRLRSDPDLRRGRPRRAGLRAPRGQTVRPDLQRADPGDASSRLSPQDRFDADLAFCGNRMPDREARVAEFFFKPAALLPNRRFLLGGNGWDAGVLNLPNIRYVGTRLHRGPQRLQHDAAGGSQHLPGEHGPVRFLAADADLRGGGSRGLHHHRQLEGNRAIPQARSRVHRGRQRSGCGQGPGRLDRRAGAAHGRPGAAQGPHGPYLRPARTIRSSSACSPPPRTLKRVPCHG